MSELGTAIAITADLQRCADGFLWHDEQFFDLVYILVAGQLLWRPDSAEDLFADGVGMRLYIIHNFPPLISQCEHYLHENLRFRRQCLIVIIAFSANSSSSLLS